MNIFIIKKSRLNCCLLSVLLLSCLSEAGASVPPQGGESSRISFFYQKNNLLLLPRYKDNHLQLKALDLLVKQHRANIGEYYFSIISYVNRKDAGNLLALNMASLQGSVARAYIRTHFRLPEEQFTFQIDTMGHESNQTSIELLPRPLPEDLSTIHYSLDRNPVEIKKAMSDYRRIPYLAVPDNREQKKQENPQYSEMLMRNVRKTDSLNRVVGQLNQDMNVKQRLLDSILHADSIFLHQSAPRFCKDTKVPFFALKTNLLYWAGFTPEMKWKQILPNLALEFYLGKRWSLEFNGAYTNYLKNGSEPKRYAFSAFGVEGRYWLRDNYAGFFGSAYVNGGQFDTAPQHIDGKGYTGGYVGAGLSLGYACMFNNWFGLELAVRGGFRHVSYDTYHHRTPHYYYESTKYKNGVKLDGAFLNMIFRFDKYKNKP